MLIAETHRWTGRIIVTRYELRRGVMVPVEVIEVENLIVSAGRNAARDAFRQVDIGIRYMAWGTGVTAPAATQTTLVTETGRKAVTSQTTGATGVLTTTTYLSATDANGTLAELGWFAGTGATATAGTGIMMARVLFPGGTHVKTSLEAFNVDRVDTFT